MPTSPRILIAADAPLEALALEDMLRASGYAEVRVTSDARQIAPLLQKWPFALLVLDMNVRPLNSLAVLEHLSPAIGRRALAVLALCDAADEVTQDRALGLGAAQVLRRPFTRNDAQQQAGAALAALRKIETWDMANARR